jgi:hypothetical protein
MSQRFHGLVPRPARKLLERGGATLFRQDRPSDDERNVPGLAERRDERLITV